MIKCPSCAAEISETNRFCGLCGSVVTPTPERPLAETMAMPTRSPSRAASTPISQSSSSVDEGRFLPGTLVADRYRTIGLLGRGGMGEVYRATDLRLGQQVALKFLPESTMSDPATLGRFHNEVR